MAKRKPYEKSQATRRGATVYKDSNIESFAPYDSRHDNVVVGKKHSDLFGEDIEVYGDSSLLDNEELSPYRVTADLGEDLVANVNAGYTILPGVY